MPIKYVPFIPEPVEGQAVLGNFNRILRYKGADEVSMTLQRGMPLYEMEKQEAVGENADGNMVIRGECISAYAYLKDRGIQFLNCIPHIQPFLSIVIIVYHKNPQLSMMLPGFLKIIPPLDYSVAISAARRMPILTPSVNPASS